MLSNKEESGQMLAANAGMDTFRDKVKISA